MTEAFASFLFDHLSGPVFVAIAGAGVSSVVLVMISSFKSLFGDEST